MLAIVNNKVDVNYPQERALLYDPYGKLLKKSPLIDPYSHELKYWDTLYDNKYAMSNNPDSRLPVTYQDSFHER